MIELAAFQPDFPANLGLMIRLAACMGMPLHVIEPCGFPFSLKAVRMKALDYGDKAMIHRHLEWDHFRARRAGKGRLILLTTSGDASLYETVFAPGDCLLVGREKCGVPAEVTAEVDLALRIPMPGGGRSLNVALAAAMAVGEAMRQLGPQERRFPHEGALS